MSLGRKIILAFCAGMICVLTAIGFHVWHSGYRVYIVHTGSMMPSLMPGDAVIDRPAHGAGGLKPGQIITFRHSGLSTDVVTHRITDITTTGLIHTKGDANGSADAWDIRPGQVEGRVQTTVPRLGYLLVFLKQPAGVASVLTIILALMLLWGLFFPTEPASTRRVPAHRHADHKATGRAPAATRRSPTKHKLQSRPTADAGAHFDVVASADMNTLLQLLDYDYDETRELTNA